MLKNRQTLYVVVNEHFAPAFCISPEGCVVKECLSSFSCTGYAIDSDILSILSEVELQDLLHRSTFL